MNSNVKKKTKPKMEKSKMDSLPSWLRSLLLFIYELSLFRILAVALGLLILVSTGNLFTADGLILSLLILLFLVLLLIRMKLKKED